MSKSCFFIATLCLIGVHGVLSGEVIGSLDCYGAGTFVALFITGCTAIPCPIVFERTYDVQIIFKLGIYQKGINVHAEITDELGISYVFDQNSSDEYLFNVEYTKRFSFVATTGYLGVSVLNIKITGLDYPQVEICRNVPLLDV